MPQELVHPLDQGLVQPLDQDLVHPLDQDLASSGSGSCILWIRIRCILCGFPLDAEGNIANPLAFPPHPLLQDLLHTRRISPPDAEGAGRGAQGSCLECSGGLAHCNAHNRVDDELRSMKVGGCSETAWGADAR